jgi:hypothetical protein
MKQLLYSALQSNCTSNGLKKQDSRADVIERLWMHVGFWCRPEFNSIWVVACSGYNTELTGFNFD